MVGVGTALRQLSAWEVEAVPWNDRPMSCEVNCTFVKSNNDFTLVLISAFLKSLPMPSIFNVKEKYRMDI